MAFNSIKNDDRIISWIKNDIALNEEIVEIETAFNANTKETQQLEEEHSAEILSGKTL